MSACTMSHPYGGLGTKYHNAFLLDASPMLTVPPECTTKARLGFALSNNQLPDLTTWLAGDCSQGCLVLNGTGEGSASDCDEPLGSTKAIPSKRTMVFQANRMIRCSAKQSHGFTKLWMCGTTNIDRFVGDKSRCHMPQKKCIGGRLASGSPISHE